MASSRKLVKSRLVWRCRRGMFELDFILENFCKQSLENLSAEELQDFQTLLECPDSQLYDWFFSDKKPEDSRLAALVSQVLTASRAQYEDD